MILLHFFHLEKLLLYIQIEYLKYSLFVYIEFEVYKFKLTNIEFEVYRFKLPTDD